MPSYLYFDTETTGFANSDHIIQIAAVQLDEQLRVEGVWSTYVNPRLTHIPLYNVHRITPAMVAGAPTFAKAVDRLADLMAGRVPVAHNLGFDQRMVNANAERAGHSFRVPDGVCTVELAREVLLKPHRNKLADLCRRFGVPLTNAHDAQADALAGAEVFRQLVRVQERTARLHQHPDPQPAPDGSPEGGLPVEAWLARLSAPTRPACRRQVA